MSAPTPPANAKSRKKIILASAVALFAAGLVALASWVSRDRAPERSAPIQARLELAAGEVLLTNGKEVVPLVSGTALLQGAELTTGAGARALIRLPDGSKAFLRGGTRVTLSPDGVELQRGEYWLDAPPSERKALLHRHGKTELSASDAGLSFRADEGRTVIYAARGMAIASGPHGRVEIHAGEQATLGAGKPPQVEGVTFWEDWTGGMADFDSGFALAAAGSGTLYGVDDSRPGTKPSKLEIARQSVRAAVREGVSETEVDQTFFNAADRPMEGWYWFTLPDRASVTSFAVETDGVLVDGEFIERQQAAANYARAKSTGHAPAILEWIDSGTYRARIYPVPAGGSRRIVLRYLELTPMVEGRLTYVYPMGSGAPTRIGEFALTAELGEAGRAMRITTLADARVEESGQLVTLRRSGYTPRAPFQLEAVLPPERAPLRVARFEAGDDAADYVMARYVPDVEWAAVKDPPGDVVVVVDTSAAGDESERRLKVTAAEAVLRALSKEDHFALLSLDASAKALHPRTGLARAEEAEIEGALGALADHPSGGATDLAALFDVALERLHDRPQPALIYIGDGIATSGIVAPDQLLARLRRALGSSAARFFTVGVGSEADHPLLAELARVGGGQSARIARAEEATRRALELVAQVKTPTLTDLELDLGAGLDEPFLSSEGPLSRGQEVTLLARTHHPLPAEAEVRFRLAGETMTRRYALVQDTSVTAAFVPRLWAAEQIRRLLGSERGQEAQRGKVAAIGIEYGLMTPFTSILALESEEAYSRLGIQRRRSPLRGVRLTELDIETERALATRFAASLPVVSAGFGCAQSEEVVQTESASAPMAKPAAAQTGAAQTGAAQMGAAQTEVPGMAEPVRLAVEPAKNEAPAPPEVDLAEERAQPRAAARPTPRVGAFDGPQLVDGWGQGDSSDTSEGSASSTTAQTKRYRSAPRRAGRPAPQARAEEPQEELAALGSPARERKPAPRRAASSSPALLVCSDAAARPLWDRAVLWRQRLAASGADEAALLDRYEAAQRACELSDWQSERVFLILMQRLVRSASGARFVLDYFATRPEVQKYLAKLILRRTTDPALTEAVRAVLFGDAVDWVNLDLELQAIADPEQRLERLRAVAARAPSDSRGTIRLVRALIEAKRAGAAVDLSRQLRNGGLVTPDLARELGDVLAHAGYTDESARTYSEIVEFDADDAASRRLLGDVYLAHGWYERAYRQYATLADASPADPMAWLRLAAAAAGAGRIDEALRLERRVATAQGSPGPNDPRRWARVASAARLARLLADDSPNAPTKSQRTAIERKLRELELFSSAGVLHLLTWENLLTDLSLTALVGGNEIALGQRIDATPIGLDAVLLSPADATGARFAARRRSVPESRAVPFEHLSIHWDGKSFVVTRRLVELPPGESEALL